MLEGATTLRGRGYDTPGGPPCGPVVDALRGVLAAPGLAGAAPEWLTEAERLLPDLRRQFPALPEPAAPTGVAARWRVFEGVAQVMLAVAAERPTVLFIDDLQWGDGETCALLDFLARRFVASPVLLVGTVAIGALERASPAGMLCRGWRTRPETVVVALDPLSEAEVWQLLRALGRIRSATGGQRLARRLHEVTDGNPFHVTELLKTLFARGFLVVDAETGEWRAAQTADGGNYVDLELPRSVHDAVGQRVARLPYELRDLLATLAVAGRGADTGLLSHVHGTSRLRAAALTDALVERRLAVAEGGVYRCAHPVIAAVVREQLTPARRVEIHRAIALSLVAVHAPAEAAVASDIARHAERGGERPLAYRYGVVAADAAARGYAFEEALGWLDVAEGAAADEAAAEDVARRRTAVLELAGWSEPPGPRARTSGRTIERRDVDLAPEAAPGA
jgi:hypothetical protein